MSGIAVTLIAAGTLAIGGACPLPLASAPVRASTIAGAPCLAEAPVGEPFAGEVLQVVDGRTICVAQGPSPQQWIKVTLADATASDSRSALMTAAFARRVVCVAVETAAEGVVGHCALDGVSVERAARQSLELQ